MYRTPFPPYQMTCYLIPRSYRSARNGASPANGRTHTHAWPNKRKIESIFYSNFSSTIWISLCLTKKEIDGHFACPCEPNKLAYRDHLLCKRKFSTRRPSCANSVSNMIQLVASRARIVVVVVQGQIVRTNDDVRNETMRVLLIWATSCNSTVPIVQHASLANKSHINQVQLYKARGAWLG